jgi:hypothetical protein
MSQLKCKSPDPNFPLSARVGDGTAGPSKASLISAEVEVSVVFKQLQQTPTSPPCFFQALHTAVD